jgi:hypothetical protein
MRRKYQVNWQLKKFVVLLPHHSVEVLRFDEHENVVAQNDVKATAILRFSNFSFLDELSLSQESRWSGKVEAPTRKRDSVFRWAFGNAG